MGAVVTESGVEAGIAPTAGTYRFLKDALGSITEILDSTNTLKEHIVYSSFGVPLQILDTNRSPVSSAQYKFIYGYTGRELDRESGLYYYRARYYDPTIGRFLQKDPHPGKMSIPNTSVNSYIYTINSPWDLVDPTGKSFISGLFTLLAGIGAAIGAVFAAPLVAIGLAAVGAGLISASFALFKDASWPTVVNSFLYGMGSAAAAIGGAIIGAALFSAVASGVGVAAFGAFAGGFSGSYLFARANGASARDALLSGLVGGFGGVAGILGAPSLNPGDVTPVPLTAPLPEEGMFFLPIIPNSTIPGGQPIHVY